MPDRQNSEPTCACRLLSTCAAACSTHPTAAGRRIRTTPLALLLRELILYKHRMAATECQN